MKRIESHFERSVPAKRFKPNGVGKLEDITVTPMKSSLNEWEETMTTPRIIELRDKLYSCLSSPRDGKTFLKCIEDEECTIEELKEVVLLQVPDGIYGGGGILLHKACSILDFNSERSIEVLRKLIAADVSTLYAQNSGMRQIPLQRAICRKNVPSEIIELFLTADRSDPKSTLFMKDADGDLALHFAVIFEHNIRNVHLILSNLSDEHKKVLLFSKNNEGHTPFHEACYRS